MKWRAELRGSGKSKLAYIPIIAITANALKGDAEKASAQVVMCTCPSRSTSVNYGRALKHLCPPLKNNLEVQSGSQ